MPRALILTNAASGRGRGRRACDEALPRLHGAGWTTRVLAPLDAGEALTAVRRALDDEPPDALVVCGGDGTVSVAVQALAGSSVPLGLVPAGTGNDLARALGVPLGDPAAAVAHLLRRPARSVDLARVGDRLFGGVLSAGFDAAVNARAERMRWPRGAARYPAATVAELPRLAPRRYVLDLDGRTEYVEAVLVAVANSPFFGGGLRVAPDARVDDDLLDVVVIRSVGRMDLVRTFPKLYDGRHVDHPAVSVHRARRVSVAAPGVVAHADGERVGPLPLSVESVPAAVQVLA